MGLEDRVVVFGDGALAEGKGLRDPAGLDGEGILDTEFAGQNVAMKNKSIGVGNALAGAGHDKFSVVTF
jgi:hypothetical protein